MIDTICAIATAPGGALGVIRISGCQAIEIASKMFFPKSGKDFRTVWANHATFGTIEFEGQVIDEVVGVPFYAPHSYTGENSVEFSCHGSQYILSKIIHILISYGCRTAQPGEYTKRAFLNGKMDLSQAEAVADVISANSEAYSKIAINQLKGGIKDTLSFLHKKIVNLRSLLELELDFSDHEDLEFAQRPQLRNMANEIKHDMDKLASTFSMGNTIKNGIPVAIAGSPNAGKSTLMNALLKEERAIVSDIPGTTRDTIEEKLYINGIEFILIDTAGLRKTNDKIESLGIERTKETVRKAQTIIYVVSASEKTNSTSFAEINIPKGTQLIIAVNKTDLISDKKTLEKKGESIKKTVEKLLGLTPAMVYMSAKEKIGIECLKKTLADIQNVNVSYSANTIIVNKRHYEALTKASADMQNVINSILNNVSAELVSLDLRQVDYDLMKITGAATSQEVLNNIFSKFCVGK
mgnify:FL=1